MEKLTIEKKTDAGKRRFFDINVIVWEPENEN